MPRRRAGHLSVHAAVPPRCSRVPTGPTVWGPVMEKVVGMCGKDKLCSVYSCFFLYKTLFSWLGGMEEDVFLWRWGELTLFVSTQFACFGEELNGGGLRGPAHAGKLPN